MNDRDQTEWIGLIRKDLDYFGYEPLGSLDGAVELLHRHGSFRSASLIRQAQLERQNEALWAVNRALRERLDLPVN
jgi:hypothetical protein